MNVRETMMKIYRDIVENEDPPPEVSMADNRTMAELLQAPTEGYEDAIVIPEIAANNFELCSKQAVFEHDKEDPHAHIRYFNKIISTMRDLLNFAAGGNFMDKMPRVCLKIIESKSKVRQSRAKAIVTKVSTSSSTPAISSEVAELKDIVRALLLDKKNQSSAPAHFPTPAPVKALEPNCVTCGGSGTLLSNTITNLKEYLKGITTRSGVAYQGPTIPTPSKVVKQGTELVVSPVSALMPNLKSSILYPSRHDNERRCDQANEQIEKFYEIFKDMSFEISFTDALILMPKFSSTQKALIGNKEKLSEMARTPMNEHCLAVILNKLPRNLGDPGKFLILCEFPGMDECLALADLGPSINLMPPSVWEGLSLSKLTLTCVTLELVDRSVSRPIGIAKDVSVKVGVFHFLADFVVVDFEPESRVPLILGRCFLKTGRALIDVCKGELTLSIGNEAITYNLDQTTRYSANYNQMTANKIDVIDMACEEYSQEVLGFSDVTASGNPTPYDDPIVSTTSPTLTSFGDSDFLLFEEADAFLGQEDDPNLPKINPFYYDLEGDILLLEAILNSEPLPPLHNHEQYMPSFKKELKGDNKLSVIIAKELGDEEKSALIKVLKSHKRAIAWKLSDIQGINLEFFTHKILMEEDYKPAVQHQRRVNPKIHDVIKKEVEKLLDAGLIYPISDSPWVSPVHYVPKKGGFTVVKNEENELILTRNEYYCFLNGFSGYFQIPIDPRDQEKTTFTAHTERLHIVTCLSTMEVFMDDFSVFGTSFENCLSRLDKMLQRCEDTNLCLNWEKSHFMVKEGIVLGHKISKNEIEVEKDKVDVIVKLPHPIIFKCIRSFLDHADCIKAFQMLKKKLTEAPILIAPNWDLPFELMCDASNFAIVAVLGQHREKHFRPIHYASKTMTDAESNYTATEKEMLAVVYAFKKFWSYLIMNKSIVDTHHSALKYLFAKKDAKSRLLRWILLLQEFVFKVLDTKGAENLAADHLVTHRLSTVYHPQTSGQVEVSNRGLKRILKRTIGENCASWSDKLDDALWAFRRAYKTPIGCTPYKLVYGKACHLLIELEHKAYWALKQVNFDLTVVGDHRKVQLNELNELRDHAYENSLIYKEKTKRIHDSKIKNRVFNVGDRVLLFNSRLKIFSGKLKTRWSGHFNITKVFPYGTVELSQANGPNFKVNSHRVKHYFGGDVP
nr:reverse transcriptase domain-containing protein [Tanacetum cinerariifolium]